MADTTNQLYKELANTLLVSPSLFTQLKSEAADEGRQQCSVLRQDWQAAHALGTEALGTLQDGLSELTGADGREGVLAAEKLLLNKARPPRKAWLGLLKRQVR